MKKLIFVFVLLHALVSRADDFRVLVEDAAIVNTYAEDEYSWLVRFPFVVDESITTVMVSQKNDWAYVPYSYYIKDLDKRYFEAGVDNEYDTKFKVYAYSQDKLISTFEFVFHPTPEMLEHFTTGIDETADQTPCRIISVHTLSGKNVASLGAVTNWQTYLRTLPKGIYIVTFLDEKGNRFSRKLSIK